MKVDININNKQHKIFLILLVLSFSFIFTVTIISIIFFNISFKSNNICYFKFFTMDLYNAYKSKNNNNKDKDVKFYSRYISKRNFEKDNFFQKTKVIASISIPKLGLYNIDIVEGVSEKVLDSSIGHFESTSLKNGNIGLAAHNRGYNVNYFANIHKLENGDLIEYSIDGEKFQYFVILNVFVIVPL